jgi:hypothetical protein
MVQSVRTAFPRRRNPDGSSDSICPECFRTVATAATEADLKAAESTHDCEGFSLREMMHGTEPGDRRNRS